MNKQVDATAIKVNQAFIVGLVSVAFVLDQPWLVVFVAFVLAVGAQWPQAALFQQVYRLGLRPMGVLKPRVIADDPMPHRFAQAIGATFLALGSLFLLSLDVEAAGWALAGLVVVLAAINLLFNFCAGCFIYAQLARLGLLQQPERTA